MVKPSRKTFLIILFAMTGVLIAYGVSRMLWGPFLPEIVDKNLPDILIIVAIGIMLWNRQLRNEEDREAKAKREAEEAAAKGGEDEGAGN
jgi:hypothetical protein